MTAKRHDRNLDAGPLQPMIDSHQLELARLGKKPKTLKTYREAAQWRLWARAYATSPAGSSSSLAG